MPEIFAFYGQDFPEEERRCRAVRGIDQGIAMSATIERRIVSGISTVLALSGLSGGVQKLGLGVIEGN